MSDQNLWWGYVHQNGTLQAKRYFDKRDIEEAADSDFVSELYGTFEATDRQHAMIKISGMSLNKSTIKKSF